MHLCASCRRHVKQPTCPFCGHTGTTAANPSLEGWARLSRTQLAAAVSLAAAACNASPTQASAYGAPPPPLTTPDAAPSPDLNQVPAYGAPPEMTSAPVPPPSAAPAPSGSAAHASHPPPHPHPTAHPAYGISPTPR